MFNLLVNSTTYLKSRFNSSFRCVIILALAGNFLLSGCAHKGSHYEKQCNSRAYLQNDLQSYISSRFPSSSPVRMAIIPFSVPANVAAFDAERPGLGNELAWKVHASMLGQNIVPIVEVFNRQDWPGKKEEFFTGNFGAIGYAREAEYDLVMVGLLENMQNLNQMSAFTKIIDTDSGVTAWYSRSVVSAPVQRPYRGGRLEMFIPTGRPDLLPIASLTEDLAYCIVDSIAAY